MVKAEWGVSFLSWILIICTGLYFDMIWQWYIDGALVSSIIVGVIALIYIWFHTTKQEHRDMIFEVTLFIVNSLNSKSVKHYNAAKDLERASKSQGMDIVIGSKSTWSWTKLLFWEKFGYTGGNRFLFFGLIYLLLIICAHGYLVAFEEEHFLLYLYGAIWMYYCPLIFRTTLLYPLSRKEMIKVHYVSSLLELSIVLFGYCLFGLISQFDFMPNIQFRTEWSLVFNKMNNFWEVVTYSLITLPFIQYLRRRYSFQMGLYMGISVISVIGYVPL